MNEMPQAVPMKEHMTPNEGVFAKVQKFLHERYTASGRMEQAMREIQSVNGPLTEEQKTQVAETIMPQVKGEVTKSIVGDALAAVGTAGAAFGVYLAFDPKLRGNMTARLGETARKFGRTAESRMRLKDYKPNKASWFQKNVLHPAIENSRKVTKTGAKKVEIFFGRGVAGATRQLEGKMVAAQNTARELAKNKKVKKEALKHVNQYVSTLRKQAGELGGRGTQLAGFKERYRDLQKIAAKKK